MMKMIKKYNNYIFIILLSIGIILHYSDNTFYFGVKYLTTSRVFDMMISILFSFFTFKIYLDNYYYMVLNKNNIISRVGRKKYNYIILKILGIHTIILLFINYVIDFILTRKISFLLNFFNVTFSVFIVILLPKRKEYDNEFLIIIILSIIIKLVFSYILL